ncbi:hypothetical protein GCM10027592_18520 [Spirosoma flavus]
MAGTDRQNIPVGRISRLNYILTKCPHSSLLKAAMGTFSEGIARNTFSVYYSLIKHLQKFTISSTHLIVNRINW